MTNYIIIKFHNILKIKSKVLKLDLKIAFYIFIIRYYNF